MKIHIKNLEFSCIIGILKFERVNAQKVIVNIKLDYDFCDEFINYKEVTDFIIHNMQTQKYELIEEALETLIKELKQRYKEIKKVKIKIEKPDILSNCIVGVSKKINFS